MPGATVGASLEPKHATNARRRALVKQGIDPSHNRQLERNRRAQEGATTIAAVVRERPALKDREAVIKAQRLDRLERVLFAKIGAPPVKPATPAHILDVLTTAANINGLMAAGVKLSRLSA
jgi:hypothetical protein